MTWLLALLFAAAGVLQPAQRLEPPTSAPTPAPKMVITDVVRGGQAEIDQGLVVLVAGCFPGGGCGTWLAGHRTTHGGVFRQVAELQPGDLVVVMDHRYAVTERTLVCCSGQPFTVTADLTLQTSQTGGRVWLVFASEVQAA